MKLLTLVAIAATATAVTFAPAAAKSKKHHRAYRHTYSQVQPGYAGGPYVSGYAGQYGGGWSGQGSRGGWNSRAVSDPSLGHPSAPEVSRNIGRCVEDLGYGRYEYCGW
jgi:hypothetical protein